MNVTLSPEIENWVQAKVETGIYPSADDLIKDALKLMYDFDQAQEQRKLAWLRAQLQSGISQLDAGEFYPFDDHLIEQIKQDGRKRLGLTNA